jgi:hypothetical protein
MMLLTVASLSLSLLSLHIQGAYTNVTDTSAPFGVQLVNGALEASFKDAVTHNTVVKPVDSHGIALVKRTIGMTSSVPYASPHFPFRISIVPFAYLWTFWPWSWMLTLRMTKHPLSCSLRYREIIIL